MADNVLGLLFSNIATAIREKNGESGTMKPADFPGKIMAIDAGGEKAEFDLRTGTFIPETTDALTIQHDMGVLPDVVLISITSVNQGVSLGYDSSNISFELAYSDEMLADGYLRKLYAANGSNLSPAAGIYTKDSMYDSFGCVRKATPTTFVFGGNATLPILVGAEYRWVAIAGLQKHPDYLWTKLALDGDGGLIVTGGVPGISQLEIYVDGTLAKTVDYVHGESFRADISDVAPEVREYTISVNPVGDTLDTVYPYQFSDPVTGYVLPKARGTCGDNVTWVLKDDGTLRICGTGAMTDCDWGGSTLFGSYNSSIKNVVIEDGVTSIGAYAFCDYNKGFSGLETVTIADSVTSIGVCALAYCTNLHTINIPDGVTSIGASAFQECAITEITLPASVETVGSNSFISCTALAKVQLAEGIKALGYAMFRLCSALTAIEIPESITEIPNQCFDSCSKLSSVVIGKSVISIGSGAFSGTRLGSFEIPDSVTSIDSSAFSSANLTQVTIGSGVTFIGVKAFGYNSSLVATFKVTDGWWVSTDSAATSGTSITLGSTPGKLLRDTYCTYYWHRD